MNMSGDRQLERMLRGLPDKVLRKVTRQAINAGATPVLKAARKNVPVDKAVLKKAMTKKVKVYQKSSTVLGLVGPRARAAPHAHLADKGSVLRRHKSGKSIGAMPASGFMAKSLDENRTAALDAISSKMGKGIEQEAAKLGGG
jgi:HK97 gp10 family phage protein